MRIASDLTIFAFVGFWAFVGGTWIYNHASTSTDFMNPRIVGDDTVHTGSVIRIEYDIVRYRDCRLDIGRYMERESDGREYLIQFVNQVITADSPPHIRPSGYNAQVPVELTTDRYKVFSRVRYHCSWLDEIDQRTVNMPGVYINVIGIDPSKSEQPK